MGRARGADSACIFCRIIGGEIPARKVHDDSEVIAVEDVNPQAPVHVLVLPRAHVATLDDLASDDRALAGHMVLVATEVARSRGIDQKGYRLVWNCREDGGQSVNHLHLHLLGGRRMQWPPG